MKNYLTVKKLKAFIQKLEEVYGTDFVENLPVSTYTEYGGGGGYSPVKEKGIALGKNNYLEESLILDYCGQLEEVEAGVVP